ncbi:hypothetical protein [Paenirhodobacter sp.]|uniref:hypothetical protein n=1 Tax=Paenirhodobacter sp. TaxID=1965326 RepID=UPI003B3D77B5
MNTIPPRPRDDAALWRRAAERALYLIAVAALIAMLWLLVFASPQGGGHARTDSAGLTQALATWSRVAPDEADVTLNTQPDAAARDWLRAIAATGTSVSWQNGAAPVFTPLGLTAEPVADPKHPTRIWVAAPGGTVEELILPPVEGQSGEGQQAGDAEAGGGSHAAIDRQAVAAGQNDPQASDGVLGMPIADLPAGQSGGGLIQWPGRPDALRLLAGEGHAGAVLHDSLTLKPVLLLARAGWEPRFAAAALERQGWQVEMRLSLGPDREVVSEDEPSPITTETYAAVLVFDDSAEDLAQEIAGFVRDGGGLMLFGKAAALPQWRGLLPAVRMGLEIEATEFAGEDEGAVNAAALSDMPVEQNAIGKSQPSQELAAQNPAEIEARADAPPPQDAAGAVPADVEERTEPATLQNAADSAPPIGDPRDHLALTPLEGLADGAEVLERRGDNAAIALRRFGEGRVWQSGYVDLWRWPMAAQDDAAQGYQDWLAGWLSLVAQAPRGDATLGVRQIGLDDPAPMAEWVAAFGPAGPGGAPVAERPDLIARLFATACLALLLHWASRRLRGAM